MTTNHKHNYHKDLQLIPCRYYYKIPPMLFYYTVETSHLPLMCPLPPTLILHPNPRIIRRLGMRFPRLLSRIRRVGLGCRCILTAG